MDRLEKDPIASASFVTIFTRPLPFPRYFRAFFLEEYIIISIVIVLEPLHRKKVVLRSLSVPRDLGAYTQADAVNI